jgi:hypothetical protein
VIVAQLVKKFSATMVRQLKPDHLLTPNYFKIHFNIMPFKMAYALATEREKNLPLPNCK